MRTRSQYCCSGAYSGRTFHSLLGTFNYWKLSLFCSAQRACLHLQPPLSGCSFSTTLFLILAISQHHHVRHHVPPTSAVRPLLAHTPSNITDTHSRPLVWSCAHLSSTFRVRGLTAIVATSCTSHEWPHTYLYNIQPPAVEYSL